VRGGGRGRGFPCRGALKEGAPEGLGPVGAFREVRGDVLGKKKSDLGGRRRWRKGGMGGMLPHIKVALSKGKNDNGIKKLEKQRRGPYAEETSKKEKPR